MAADGFNEKNSNLLSPNSDENASPPFRPSSGASAVSSTQTVNEKRVSSNGNSNRTHSHSISSNVNTVTSSKGSASGEGREKQRAVRTLPPWVQSVGDDDDDDDYLRPPSRSPQPPRTPPAIRPASHHYTPQPNQNADRGRKFDHERVRTPPTISSTVADSADKWSTFMKASAYGGPSQAKGERVNDAWMKENLPDLESPWEPENSGEDEENEAGFWLLNPRRRKKKISKWHEKLMRDARIPAIFRTTVLGMSCIALGLSGTIFHKTGLKGDGCERGSSTYLAIIVDTIAIPYTLYITYDEYANKPLGLRSHRAKMRLMFLDLFFIVFMSANLSVAFESLTDGRWVCRDGDDNDNSCRRDDDICNRQIALVITILLALLAWLSTFSISTLRIVERAVNR